jgi:hypothetical protein
MRLKLKRWYRAKATYGDLEVIDDTGLVVFRCKTLELPWKGNERNISCIPEGRYEVHKEGPSSTRAYVYFRVQDVPGRSGILFHPGTYTSHILGCILPGEILQDINTDGVLDILNTAKTLKKLTDFMPDKFTLEITNAEKRP